MILAGDIGGTKTNLAVYSHKAGLDAPLAEATFPSRRYESLVPLVQEFVRNTHLSIGQAVFGVAGPVVNGKAEVTNLPWQLEEQQLAQSLSLQRVKLLNDLESIANAVPALRAADVHTLHPGDPQPHAPIGVVAPGTGLGEAFLTWDGARYQAHPSEGGHTSFGPLDAEQIELLRFLLGRHRHVSYERVCSGMGIPNLYAFLKETGRCPEPDWLAQELAEADDPTPVIVNAGLARPADAPICRKVLELFVAILGAEAGNLALKTLATGGIYLGGGIPPRVLPVLEEGAFLAAFQAKGRFAQLLEQIPVHVILNPKAALLGAAQYGLSVLV